MKCYTSHKSMAPDQYHHLVHKLNDLDAMLPNVGITGAVLVSYGNRNHGDSGSEAATPAADISWIEHLTLEGALVVAVGVLWRALSAKDAQLVKSTEAVTSALASSAASNVESQEDHRDISMSRRCQALSLGPLSCKSPVCKSGVDGLILPFSAAASPVTFAVQNSCHGRPCHSLSVKVVNPREDLFFFRVLDERLAGFLVRALYLPVRARLFHPNGAGQPGTPARLYSEDLRLCERLSSRVRVLLIDAIRRTTNRPIGRDSRVERFRDADERHAFFPE